jgi:hypothetical protein
MPDLIRLRTDVKVMSLICRGEVKGRVDRICAEVAMSLLPEPFELELLEPAELEVLLELEAAGGCWFVEVRNARSDIF